MSANVFIFAPADKTGDTHDRLEAAGCKLVLGKASWETPMGDNEAEMVAMAKDADAMCGTSIRSTPISRTVMEASDHLRIVAKYTIGVDDIDVEAATEMGILVTNAPTESNWGAVAEGTVAIMLAVTKRLRERDRHLKTGGHWRDSNLEGTFIGSREEDGYPGITLGIVGLGRIGARVSKLMRPWGIQILACDPYVPSEKFGECGVEQTDLRTLLQQSDVVSMHVTLTKETRHMIGEEEFKMMKPDAVFLNTSRGYVVDEAALARALEDGVIAAAAIDAFEDEPLAMDSPLRNLGDKVLLSPHMIASNRGAGLLGAGVQWGTRSIMAALRGEVPDCVFNTDVIPRWQERFGGKSIIS